MKTVGDESAVSTEAVGSAGDPVSTLETSEVKDGQDFGVETSSIGVETSSTSSENATDAVSTTGSEVATDESIISTADLRDVFNRLEVIVQKLARGGAVW